MFCCFADNAMSSGSTAVAVQVNHSPSFSTETPLDLTIKKQLILETLALLKVDAKQLRRSKAADKQQAAERLLRAKGRATDDQPSAVSLDEMQSIRYDQQRNEDGTWLADHVTLRQELASTCHLAVKFCLPNFTTHPSTSILLV